MDLTGKSRKELVDLLIQFAASVKEEDLKNPETFGLAQQLVQLLDGQPEPLPQDMVDQLAQIKDKADRFRQAALYVGAINPPLMDKLRDAMKAAGLLKSEATLDDTLRKSQSEDHSESHCVMFPATIRGQAKHEKAENDYHVTLKYLGKRGSEPDGLEHQIETILGRHKIAPPHEIRIKPHKFETPKGDVHVLLLDGAHPELHSAHKDLSHLNPDWHGYVPHITVPKELHDEVKEKGLTAQDLDLKLHPLEYRIGPKPVRKYAPQANEGVIGKPWGNAKKAANWYGHYPWADHQGDEEGDDTKKSEDDGSGFHKFYHITDNPNFKLDPNHTPEDNAISIHNRSGQKGIYVASDVEKWVNGHGYHRPFVAEIHVPKHVLEQPGVHGRWGGEKFIPSHLHDQIKVHRVVPIDAIARETYGQHGWFEGSSGKEFDTGKEITAKPHEYPFRNYKYPHDVRAMSPKDQGLLKQRFEEGRKARIGKSELAKGQNGEWKKEGYEVREGKAGLAHDYAVEAHHPQHGMVGRAAFKVNTTGTKLIPVHVAVAEAHRRKGIATAMYCHAEKLWAPIANKASHQTSNAMLLWEQKNRPFGKRPKPLKKSELAATPTVPNTQAAGAGVKTYPEIAKRYGTLTPGRKTNLNFYNYAPHEAKIDKLIADHGYKTELAGGKYGRFDLKQKNYNTGHLMIYDPTPSSGGDFGDEATTRTWRKVHELSHALTYPQLNEKYGEGRRLGKLGTRSLREATRAVEWEWLAAHKQRELSKQIGVEIPDDVFHRELNTVLHDAVHRAIHGKFTEPSDEGFYPSSEKIPLEHAIQMVREHGARLGLEDDTPEAPKADEPVVKSLIDRVRDALEKSKNVREQKKKIFGGWKTTENSPEREKQMGALSKLTEKRYGLETARAPGKPNVKGKVIDKPDLTSGKVEHIGNPDSLAHEMAHVELAPEGKGLPQHQRDMDKEWGRQNRNPPAGYGYKQQARVKDEYVTTAVENPLRRRAGLPAHQKEVYKRKDRTEKRLTAADAPGKPIVKVVKNPKGGKDKWFTGTSENRSPEANARMERVDNGEIKFDKDKGWQPATSVHAKINARAREAVKEIKTKTQAPQANEAVYADGKSTPAQPKALPKNK